MEPDAIDDHRAGHDGQGHLSHMAERIRHSGAIYYSGLDGAGTSDYVETGAGTVYFKMEGGIVYQMHRQVITAKDTNDRIIVTAECTDLTLVAVGLDSTSSITGSITVNPSGAQSLSDGMAFYDDIAFTDGNQQVRIKAIEAWIILGSISTATLFIFSPSNFLINTIIMVILGISVGAGFPSSLSFFAENTKIENRGFTGGIIWSLVGICVLGFAALYMNFDMLQMITLLSIWRFFGWVGFKSLNKNRQEIDVQKSPSYLELLTDRKILLYLFPWIMFTIINFAETPIVQELFR